MTSPWKRRTALAWRIIRLAARNRLSRKPVLGTGPVVSLTTFGARTATVHRSIESIGRGSLRPARLVLVLAAKDAERGIPAGLRRLQRRGLEITIVEKDIASYKKFYPLVSSDSPPATLVTADDDVCYPPDWLADLAAAAAADPQHVYCHRAWWMGLDKEAFTPYRTWLWAPAGVASHRVQLTGAGGVLYPPSAVQALRAAGDGFTTTAPRADDLWIAHVLLRAGIRTVRLEGRFGMELPTTLAGGRQRLTDENVAGGGNDRVLASLYTAADFAVLRAEPEHAGIPQGAVE
jgi:hypothetical protein